MKAGERIDCIRKITNTLSSFEWADIDLVLGQFKLPTSSSWAEDKDSYVIHHTKDAPNNILKELENYLIPKDSPDNNSPDKLEEAIWKQKHFKLFLSHISANKKLVTEVKENLLAYGIDSFVAHQDIDPANEWQNIIESALQSCDALAAFLTKDFHSSKWTDQEIGFCVARRVLIIPLKFETNPYGFIGKYQAKDCSKLNAIEIAKEIFNVLVVHPLSAAKMAEAIVSSFVESGSWESARARSLLLKRVVTWTPELLRSIEGSLESNSHIPTAWGVPETIKEILEKFS